MKNSLPKSILLIDANVQQLHFADNEIIIKQFLSESKKIVLDIPDNIAYRRATPVLMQRKWVRSWIQTFCSVIRGSSPKGFWSLAVAFASMFIRLKIILRKEDAQHVRRNSKVVQ